MRAILLATALACAVAPAALVHNASPPPASAVGRIVIRGGAPGVDMEGEFLVAKVILKTGAALGGDMHDEKELRSDLKLKLIGLRRLDRTGSDSEFVNASDDALFGLTEGGDESVARSALSFFRLRKTFG
jgi:hypothetical protein